MSLVSPGIEVIDLEYLNEPLSVASVFIDGDNGIAIVDPGPSTSLGVLRRRLADRGASVDDVTAILLTHIHLDHAGGTGTLIRDNPRIRVFVHERGASHMADPSRLLRSATRIYGDQMERLWQEMLPVPSSNLQILGDQDVLSVAGRTVRSAYTPGHAWHHVSYLDEQSGVVFVGDTAGERYPGQQYVMPVAPPPDVDLDRWKTSTARIAAWNPRHLIITHFGAFPDPEWHLSEHEHRLTAWAAAVQRTLAEPGTDAERRDRFVAQISAELSQHLPPAIAEHYAGSVPSSWDGLARYWRQQ